MDPRPSLILALVVASCSGGTSNPSNPGGTSLASGTACVAAGSGAEHCSTSGNTARRSVSSGEILVVVAHEGTDDFCEKDQAAFSLQFNVPDGVALPYQKTGNQRGSTGYHEFNDGACFWTNNSEDFPVSGTVYRAGTNGASRVEADLSVKTINAVCLPATGGCPDVTMRVRFNLPL